MTPDELATEDANSERGECLRDQVWADDYPDTAQGRYERQLYGGDS